MMKKRNIFILTISPILLSFLWSFYPFLQAKLAAKTLDVKLLAQENGGVYQFYEQDVIRKNVQTHFRKFKIHIPFEDIQLRPLLEEKKILTQNSTLCQRGKVLVWIPYSIRVPQFVQRKLNGEFCSSYL